MTKLAIHTFNDVAFGDRSEAISRIVKRLIKGSTLSDADLARQAALRRARERRLKAAQQERSIPPHPDKKAQDEGRTNAAHTSSAETQAKTQANTDDIRPTGSIWYRLFQRFVLGLSFVGALSFFNLLISFSFYAPARIMQGGRRLFGNRRGGDRARGGVDLGTIMIFVFVAVGVARCVFFDDVGPSPLIL